LTRRPNTPYHVVPIDDLREHDLSWTCWCQPRPDTECDDVCVHNAMDQREQYEEGRKKS
jgi:hypothetical protein